MDPTAHEVKGESKLAPVVLLLNAANMATFPVYPYAFIQVTAVARRAGIRVVCHDLLGSAQAAWPARVEEWISRYEPRMILITLRNTDSLTLRDYVATPEAPAKPYFPIEATQRLINVIRQLDDMPVAVGGFGFSLLAKDLMPVLRPDCGVVGGSDAFFDMFQDVLSGHYAKVPNLLYFKNQAVIANERVYFPPSAVREYTPEVIDEMLAFYRRFAEPGFQGAPVEIMRGCNHSCVFCAEPHVAGHDVRYRDHEAIMADIEILNSHGVTDIYMISSELNPQGNGFILQLADRIQTFNAQLPAARRVSWFGANYLLGFSANEYRQLEASGFTGGWFDISALDDENARAMRTPYRNRSLLPHLQIYLEWQRRKGDHSKANGATADLDNTMKSNLPNEEQKPAWTMFLGNPATTMETIRRTLAAANREGLATAFGSCHIIRPTRLFDYEKPSTDVLNSAFSINNERRRVLYKQVLPSFTYPPALLDHLGSEEDVETMFAFVGDTLLSTSYEESRDWVAFLQQHPPQGLPEVPPGAHLPTTPASAKAFVDHLLHDWFGKHAEWLAGLGLPASLAELDGMTPYALAAAIYRRWRSEEELLTAMERASGVAAEGKSGPAARFFVKAILHRFNLRILPEYQALFVVRE